MFEDNEPLRPGDLCGSSRPGRASPALAHNSGKCAVKLSDENWQLQEARIRAHQERVSREKLEEGIQEPDEPLTQCARCGTDTPDDIVRRRRMGWQRAEVKGEVCPRCMTKEHGDELPGAVEDHAAVAEAG